MMSRTTRAGLRLQWKNNLGFSGLRRLGFCSIKSIIKQTKFLNAWIDCCRHFLERSYTVSQVNTASVQAYRTRARPAGGHRDCLGTGAVANTLPHLPEIVISETEKTKHTMQIQAGRTG